VSRVGEIPTHGSIGRGLETDPRNGYTGTKLETADTAKPEPTGHRDSPRPSPSLEKRRSLPRPTNAAEPTASAMSHADRATQY